MEDKEIQTIFANPFYAVNISPSLCAKHEPMVSKETWIKANAKMMYEIGREKWLEKLLSTLESGGEAKK